MYYWTKYPDQDQLPSDVPTLNENNLPLTNGHLHTPYSFSAFSTTEQSVQLASKEGLKVAGINDFNTVKGYADWAKDCDRYGIIPLFNIEMIGLNTEDQINDIKVNDPSNPGRTYISGKGLSTAQLPGEVSRWLNDAIEKNNKQSEAMTKLLNKHLEKSQAPFSLNYEEIFQKLTMGQVRERHLARALRIKAEDAFNDRQTLKSFFEKITGKNFVSLDAASVENTLRGALLKSGGPAFIPEDPNSFASLDTIRNLILKAKGVPTYPFLGDALNGACTGFEENLESTMGKLKERGFFSTEFITTRNSMDYLEQTAQRLWENGFLVTLGTEHNTPAMEPMVPAAKGNTAITGKLQLINVMSLCILIAHQYLTGKTGEGWLNPETGNPKLQEKEYFIKTGWTLLNL
jgi:hypothetical protein